LQIISLPIGSLLYKRPLLSDPYFILSCCVLFVWRGLGHYSWSCAQIT